MSWEGWLLIGGIAALIVGGLWFTTRQNDGADE